MHITGVRFLQRAIFASIALAASVSLAFSTAAPSRGGGVPGVAPAMPPASSPSPSAPAAPGAMHAPIMRTLTHQFVSEGTYLVDKPMEPAQDVISHCGTNPSLPRWGDLAQENLKDAYRAEKQYFQEKNAFASLAAIGFTLPVWDRACLNYSVTVGHHTGDKSEPAFFITARHNLGGPMYCTTTISGAHGAGYTGVSNAGGPILNPDQCAALPAYVASFTTLSAGSQRAGNIVLNPPKGSTSNAMAPALVKAATPYALELTNDLTTCTQHTGSQQTCVFDIVSGRAIMTWDGGTSCGNWPSCTTHIAGYRIYRVPFAPSKANAPSNMSVSQSSSSASSAIARPANSNPATLSANTAALPANSRQLVATITDSDHKGGIATASGVYATYVAAGKCFVVVAFLQNNDEGDDSPQFCVAGPVTVGPQKLDLTPIALVTAYGHQNMCTDAPPFAHPGGSILMGFTVTAAINGYSPGYRCRRYEGLMKFDLSGISPPLVHKAVLTYSKVTNYKLNGATDPSPGICVPVLYDTSTDWASGAVDPRLGLVQLGKQIDNKSSDDFYHTDLTTTVNSMLQSGKNNGFVMASIDWNGPESWCFTSFGDFHLIVTAFGHH